MNTSQFKTAFQVQLLAWFAHHGRNLTFRKTKNPFHIWLSEIIFQQTQIAQGMPYFEYFIQRFANVEDLANASLDEVLKMWQGLGYYSRARNLHAAAKQIVNEFDNQFPHTFSQIKKLKGVGDYTAAAIASICFNECVAVVDGNVFRVLSRVLADSTPIDTALGAKHFKKLAQNLLDPRRPGDFNEAMMDLGALICTPKNPSCLLCPLQNFCQGYTKWINFPKKAKKIAKIARHLDYALVQKNGHFLMRQRTSKDIWEGLYEFVLLYDSKRSNTTLNESSFNLFLTGANLKEGNKHKALKPFFIATHTLTHQSLQLNFFAQKIEALRKLPKGYIWMDAHVKSLPKPLLLALEAFETKVLKKDNCAIQSPK